MAAQLAVRCGQLWPPQLARQIATLDQMLGGRLTANIISRDLPGSSLSSGPLPPHHRGDRNPAGAAAGRGAEPPWRALPLRGEGAEGDHGVWNVPPLYFGGLSDEARECAAQGADVYLIRPDTLPAVTEIIADLRRRAAAHGRTVRFGYRVHVVVRETEAQARDSSERLLSGLDARAGESPAPGPAEGPPSSATPSRCWPSWGSIRSWDRGFQPERLPTCRRAIASPVTCCPACRTAPSAHAPEAALRPTNARRQRSGRTVRSNVSGSPAGR